MATIRQTLHHAYRLNLKLEPINPVYENRMYVSGWLFGISTEYKKDMVSCDGYKEVWTCSICGGELDDELHKDEVIKVDSFN